MVLIDTEYDIWNIDSVVLEKAFEIYPEVRLIVVAYLYGTPRKIEEIRRIGDKHKTLIVEDAEKSFCATVNGRQTGTFGDVGVVSWNRNSGFEFVINEKIVALKDGLEPYFCTKAPMKSHIKVICTKHRWILFL